MKARTLILFTLISVPAWSGAGLAAQQQRMPSVTVGHPGRAGEAMPKAYVGAVESIGHVDLMPRVTGTLKHVHFTEGSMVTKDQLLFELEDTTYRTAADALEAQIVQQKAALALAEKEFKRSQDLRDVNAQSSFDKALAEIQGAQARLRQLEASLEDAKNTLSYTKIYAPLTGRIGKNTYSEGNLITPAGGKLNDIGQTAPIYVRFSISERVFRRDLGGSDGIREKAAVRLRLADGTLYGETGKVTLIDNKINSTTNTITLWAVFANADGKLLPGGFVTTLVSEKAEKQFVTIVPSALITTENGYCVYLLDSKNCVQERAIRTGGLADGMQIVLSGLDGSERLIVNGMHKVKPGMTAEPYDENGQKIQAK